MNKNKLKTYAPQARNDFVAAVKARAALLGISEAGVSPATKTGDVVIVEGREWPTKVGVQRERLAAKIGKEGFEAVMDRVAYTWFNRFAALRFMELHDYLGHGHRVLSNREGGLPEILFHAGDVDLPGLNKAQVVELRLAGDRDGDLYRMLLVAQCNALSAAMPFLFERIDDESELLLPDNLLRTDSVIAKMVSSIDEEDWAEVEIVGWLYQFYISEKKDEVIGSVVRSEDIPAATQLFTPDWIVKYLVQNSVGRLWVSANPSSGLKGTMEYFAEAQGEDSSVKEKTKAAFRNCYPGDIVPESIKVFDPACGSGHILVEAYTLLRGIYVERGFQPRVAARLILEKNLYGLDIDDRAAQLAGFALIMKARADDRRLLNDAGNPPKINIYSMQQSNGMRVAEIAAHLEPHGAGIEATSVLLQTFVDAKTFGSLVEIPDVVIKGLPDLISGIARAQKSGDVFAKSAADDLLPFVEQARVIATQYDAVVANPPYMGAKAMNAAVKEFARSKYELYKSDLFSMFSIRLLSNVRQGGFMALMTPFVWMFLSSYEAMRRKILEEGDLLTLVRPEYHAFFDSAFVPICAFALQKSSPIEGRIGAFVDLSEFYGYDLQPIKLREALSLPKVLWRHDVPVSDFRKVPGWAIAYWLSHNALMAFEKRPALSQEFEFRQGLATGANDKFLRLWHECSLNRIGFGFTDAERAKESRKRWFPCHKGGESRKWYGNHYFVVDWKNDGEALKAFPGSVIRNPTYYFKEGATWGSLTVSALTMRYGPPGFVFESKGAVAFAKAGRDIFNLLSLANSRVMDHFLKVLAPTMDYSQGPVGKVPYIELGERNRHLAKKAIALSKQAWDAYEVSWDFKKLPWLPNALEYGALSESWASWEQSVANSVRELALIETENEKLIIEAYGLDGELSPEIPEEQITLTRADREADCKRLLSYAIGCMMGRYSLDEPGLIYANEGNAGFDPDCYRTFPADADGILPLTDELWFDDDSTLRVVEFLRAVWGRETSDENMEWVADSLGKKNGETAEETVRRYLSASFYKDHLQTYKKRPIYWLFSSGKQKAFEALVYLHRYHEGTLARMRSEYVVPLLSKYLDRIELLGRDAEAAGSAAARTKIQKRIDALRKKHHELVAFEEKLRHMADSRIRLDLDDGVKVNYARFGDLLAETKAVTGGAED